MLAKLVEKLVSLKDTKLFEIDGQTYVSGSLDRVPPHVDKPRSIDVNGLDSICKLIRTEINKVGATIFVQAENYNKVDVFTTYQADYTRNYLYKATADVPGISTGWREKEKALIELRSLFIPNEGTAYMLDLLSRISDKSEVSTKDNGVTQTVEAVKGVALKENVDVKPRVSLKPFRTFLEVDQPESEFLLRVDEARGIAFFEADGGVWKLEAKQNIANYFEQHLKDLIEAGLVVVMR